MIVDSKKYTDLTSKTIQRKLTDNERMIKAIRDEVRDTKGGEAPVVNVDAPVVNVTVPTPKVTIENNAEPFPDKLVFDIIRDKEGRMKQVIMRKPK
jgi:hypothetical protein